MIKKESIWLAHELTDRDMERQKTICKILFQRLKRKIFLYRIVTGDENWIHYDNLKRSKA